MNAAATPGAASRTAPTSRSSMAPGSRSAAVQASHAAADLPSVTASRRSVVLPYPGPAVISTEPTPSDSRTRPARPGRGMMRVPAAVCRSTGITALSHKPWREGRTLASAIDHARRVRGYSSQLSSAPVPKPSSQMSVPRPLSRSSLPSSVSRRSAAHGSPWSLTRSYGQARPAQRATRCSAASMLAALRRAAEWSTVTFDWRPIGLPLWLARSARAASALCSWKGSRRRS